MKRNSTSFFRRGLGDERGAVIVLVAVAIFAFIGFGALVVDVGYLLYAQRALQASADAAAMAGAQAIALGGNPTTTANQYSAATSGCSPSPCDNAGDIAIKSGSNVTTSSTLYSCTTTSGISCAAPSASSPANAIQVTETAPKVSTFFGGMFGIYSVQLSATATALAAGGGPPQPVNVAFILDTTVSMHSAATGPAATVCPSSTYPNALDCALSGVQTILGELWPCNSGVTCPATPVVDQAALFIFPGVNPAAPSGYHCSTSLTPVPYNNSPISYGIVPFLADYRTSDSATAVADGVAGGNSSSDLVQCAAPASVSTSLGNSNNTNWEGGEGTYYAGAITAAQTALAAQSSRGQTNVIILLSDGNAEPKSGNGAPSTNECKLAATAAQAAAKAGTWVYAVYYDDNGNNSTCSSDTGKYTGAEPNGACYTLQQIASSPTAQPDPTKFYSTDGTSSVCPSAHSYTSISQIFQDIANSLTTGRLIPNV